MKKLTLLLAVAASLNCGAQVVHHPPAFPDLSAAQTPTHNFYKDYMGVAFSVNTPTSISGSKIYTISNDGGGGANEWGGAITAPMLNKQVVLATPDSSGCSTLTGGSMTGKIGLVFRGNCEFGAKALAAQNAGAIACVIVNNIPGSPVGMGVGAVGASVNIPVIMISDVDGAAIYAQLKASQTVTASFSTWGYGNANDLGFLFNGYTQPHAMVTPLSQLGTSNGNPIAYKLYDGAFIGNFGSADQTNVKMKSSLTWTPTGSTTAQTVKNDSFTFASFPRIDSIYAVGIGKSYDIHAITTGTYNMTYSLSMANTDQFTGDNTISQSFTVSDSIYSKGRYNFPDNGPYASSYVRIGTTGSSFFGGNLYYIANNGAQQAVSAQYKIASNASELSAESTLILLFKWKDTVVVDSMVEAGELQLVGINQRSYQLTDSTGDHFEVKFLDANGSTGSMAVMDPNSWYYVAVECSPTAFLGYDGVTNFYPRSYLRHHASGADQYTEFYASNISGAFADFQVTATSTPNALLGQYPYDGADTTTRLTVDSARYAQQRKGYVAAVALKMKPASTGVNNSVKETAKVSLYPNPANDQLVIDVVSSSSSKQFFYSIVDMTGKTQYSTKRKNIAGNADKLTVSTSSLANGTYILLVTGDDGQTSVRKFVVAH
jgi:hypothetical protein